MTADLLQTIVAAAKKSADERARARRGGPMVIASDRSPRGALFAEILRRPGLNVIAECKRRSPSRGILRHDYDPAAIAISYARAGAAAISVLTEPTFFDGSIDHLGAVRQAVELPLLRKDFVISRYQLLEAVASGADAALLIVAALDDRTLRQLLDDARALGLACLVEVHDTTEIARASDAGARVVGVNSRNLRTLAVDMDVLDRAASMLPPEVTAVAESGIKSTEDMTRLTAAGYHAFLVGERLITQHDPGAALRELRGQA